MNSINLSLSQIASVLSSPWTIRDWFLAILPIIVSIISTLFAIYVPYRIMNKQNKIALFEKRFNIYQQITEVINFSDDIKMIKSLPGNTNPSDLDIALALFSVWANKNDKVSTSYDRFIKEINPNNLMYVIKNINIVLQEQITLINSSKFLFKDNDTIQELGKRYKEFVLILGNSIIDSKIEKYELKKNNYLNFIEQNTQILKNIERELAI